MAERMHDIRIRSVDSEIEVVCFDCDRSLANLGQLPTPLQINTVGVNHYQGDSPVPLEPRPIPEAPNRS